MTHPQPYKYRTAVSQPVNPTVHQSNQKENQKRTSHFYALAPTLDIPFGSNKTSAKSTSPAVGYRTKLAMLDGTSEMIALTLSHEVFQMMPFHIVR
jgi:hypothetical protein